MAQEEEEQAGPAAIDGMMIETSSLHFEPLHKEEEQEARGSDVEREEQEGGRGLLLVGVGVAAEEEDDEEAWECVSRT